MKQRIVLIRQTSLKRRLDDLVRQQEKAMSGDDPDGTCHAYHRGQIAAYKLLLDEFCKPKERKPAPVKS